MARFCFLFYILPSLFRQSDERRWRDGSDGEASGDDEASGDGERKARMAAAAAAQGLKGSGGDSNAKLEVRLLLPSLLFSVFFFLFLSLSLLLAFCSLSRFGILMADDVDLMILWVVML